MKVNEINCKQACVKLNRDYYFNWDLNIYRGCEHGCIYCFAIYSHDYLEADNYFDEVFVKTNIVEKLEQLLKKNSWNREVINIGGVTDSYQPLENTYKFMPEILKLLIKYKTPCNISTKSDLILRDFDLIEELSSITYVNVAASITCLDEEIRQKIEPKGVSTERRFTVLSEFKKTNASTGLHFMPIIPYITDSYENIDGILSRSKDCKVDYAKVMVMNLRGKTRGTFFDFIRKEYPELFAKLTETYRSKESERIYKTELYTIVEMLINKYNLTSDYKIAMNEKLLKEGYTQISLSDL